MNRTTQVKYIMKKEIKWESCEVYGNFV